MMIYSPTQHVRAAADAGGIVFLDIARDRYLSVSFAREGGVDLWLGETTHQIGSRAAEKLCADGLIGAGQTARSTIERPHAGLDIHAGATNLAHAPAILSSCYAAAQMLRRPFATLVDEPRRLSRPTGANVEHLCTAFEAWRPYYPRARKCLFDAVALVLFLARHGHGAQIVFGVRTRPFEAHCWVQADGRALNERIERARSFQTILSI